MGSIKDLEVEVGSFGGEGRRIVEVLCVAKHLLECIKTDMSARASVLREGRQQLLGLFNRHLSALSHLARAHRLRKPHLLSCSLSSFFSRITFPSFLIFLNKARHVSNWCLVVGWSIVRLVNDQVVVAVGNLLQLNANRRVLGTYLVLLAGSTRASGEILPKP
jgi:hypothetical protein